MKTRHADLLCLLFIAVPTAMALYLWPVLPDPMPSHWNAAGEVDGYLPKFWGVALMPLVAAFNWALIKILPRISPKGFRMSAFGGVLNIIQVALVASMSFIGVFVLLEASGRDVPMNLAVFAAVGLLLVVIGNYLGKVRRNFFLGIRTPWTLASDEVWARTHRVGGRALMLAGLVMLIGGPLGMTPGWLIGSVLALALWPVLYSYLVYRRLEGFSDD